MKAVVQRAKRGRVSANGEVVGQIQSGLVVLLGIGKGDGEAEARWMANKIANLRIFAAQASRFSHSVRSEGRLPTCTRLGLR